jgi:hypothetical protein
MNCMHLRLAFTKENSFMYVACLKVHFSNVVDTGTDAIFGKIKCLFYQNYEF